ncbi:MAG: cation:proton antiporter [Candidatus Nanohaloarchaeota archaeon QJJ-5]|nr:cation:proton antiporter [Candidatus Nanohaloarchaeota archaeon QJJ-5]
MVLSFEFVLALTIVYGTNYMLIHLEKYGVPVLGIEILAGMIFGSFFGVLSPATPGYNLIISLAALGLMLIMFDAGLELDPSLLRDHAKVVSELGLMTFLVPFVAGVAFGIWLNLSIFAAVLIGITVSTTSLGLVHPLLEEFDLIEKEMGQIILSVTVLNDILSVVALAYALALTSGQIFQSVASVTLALVFFLYIAPVHLSKWLSSLFQDTIFHHTVRFCMLTMVLFALIMEQVGIHAVLGSFFAGLLIAEISHKGHDINQSMRPVTNLAAPVFFFFVGMQLPVSEFPMDHLGLIGGVLAIGIGAKVIGAYIGSHWAGVRHDTEHLLVAAMPGRLSISVAAAEIGLRQGLIQQPLYYAFIILSIISVFLSAIMFRIYAPED